MDFFMGKGDQLPYIATTLEDANGPIDLTGGTVVFYGRKKGSTTVITGNAVIDQTAPTVLTGQVHYVWGALDTQVPGGWMIKWKATLGGKPITFPNNGADELWIDPFWAAV